MGPIVVTLVAVLIVLLVGVVIAGARLAAALRRLGSAVQSAQRSMQPTIDELNEASRTASVEMAELRASIDELTEQRRDDDRRPRSDR